MDELEISGKRYISTRRAAREHGYHSDYMGQLIRGKKVVGQKVGRAWYIEEGSLNAYLGNVVEEPAKTTTPQPEPVVETPVQPAPVERLIIEEPAVAPIEQVPVQVPVQAPAAQPVYVAPVVVAPTQPVEQPVAVHHTAPAPAIMQPVQQPMHAEQPVHVRAIYHEPHVPHTHQTAQDHFSYTAPAREVVQETRIPIHTQAPVASEPVGGLKYADDDTPSIPTVTRMPQEPAYYQAPKPQRAHASERTFPYVSLSIVGIISIVGALFASNFITATIVSEEGKAASVQYSIHW